MYTKNIIFVRPKVHFQILHAWHVIQLLSKVISETGVFYLIYNISRHIQYMFILQQIEEEREIEEDKEGVAIAKAPTHVDVLTAPTRRGIRSIYSEVQRTQSSASSDSSDITCTGRLFYQLPACTPNYYSISQSVHKK